MHHGEEQGLIHYASEGDRRVRGQPAGGGCPRRWCEPPGGLAAPQGTEQQGAGERKNPGVDSIK